MRRRKPDSMEVQQMKTQAKEEKTRFLLLNNNQIKFYLFICFNYYDLI